METSEKKLVRRSALWNHFSSLPNSGKATCSYCKSSISYRGGALSNLKKHLKAKHYKAFVELECGNSEPVVIKSDDAEFAVSTMVDDNTTTLIVDEEKEKIPKYPFDIPNSNNDTSILTSRSVVWMHYSVSPLIPDKAKCDHCHSHMSFKGGSTANLRKHLKTKHAKIYKEIEKDRQNTEEIEEVNIATEPEENDVAMEPDDYPLNYFASKKGNKRRRRRSFTQGQSDGPSLSPTSNGIGAFIKFIISELNLLKDPLVMLETKWKIQESIMAGRRQQLSVSNGDSKIMYAAPLLSEENPSEVATYLVTNTIQSSEI